MGLDASSYAYAADVWCHECAEAIMARIRVEHPGVSDDVLDTGDTDDWPQPIANDEACDTPQHCADCGMFFGNPLTDDGERYVGQALAAALVHLDLGEYNAPCIAEWWNEYHGLPGVQSALVWALWVTTSPPVERASAGLWLRRFAAAGIDWEEVNWQ